MTPQAQAIAIMSEDEVARYMARFDEREFLSTARQFLEAELGCPVTIQSADAPGISDPQGKAKQAKPRRPAIYVET